MARAVPQTDAPRSRRAQLVRRKVGPLRFKARPVAPEPVGLEHALELVALSESASDGVIEATMTGVLTGWSEGAERMFGYAPKEILGKSLLLLSPGDRADESVALHEAVRAGERFELETERVAKDGRVLNVRITGAPVLDDDGNVAGGIGIYRDLSEQRRTEEALRASERRYQSVVEALNEGVMMHDASGMVVTVNQSAERILGVSAGRLIGSTSKRPPVSFVHEDGSRFLPDELPMIISMRTGESRNGVIMGVGGEGDAIRWISMNTSALAEPGDPQPYASVSSFSDITELRSTLEELRAARLEDLKRLALVGEYRDDDTNQHTGRVAHTAELLAQSLGLDGELIATIHSAAALHDVGKIGIPDKILLKPGKLTAEEFEFMKTHTAIGGRILGESDVPILKMATEIAVSHHEHWDGTGYPSRLRGEAIPITGRIIAVADAFDAMTHARPYKIAFSVGHAVAEIERCRGTQFDPEIVDAFMTLDHHALLYND
jgi:putative two-component system response regulator